MLPKNTITMEKKEYNISVSHDLNHDRWMATVSTTNGELLKTFDSLQRSVIFSEIITFINRKFK
jgi:hypothetical protein